MFSLTRLAKGCYLLAFSLVVCLLASTNPSEAQTGFGVTAGYRGTPALPIIAVPFLSGSSSGSSFGGSGGVVGAGGSGGGNSVSGSFSTQILHIDIGSFFPNDGRIIGLPSPPFEPLMNNLFYGGLFLSPLTSDTTGAPWSLLTAMGMGGVGGGAGGGVAGVRGGGAGGGGGAAGFGNVGGGVGGNVGGGGMGGFAGKGMGGFNGRKPL